MITNENKLFRFDREDLIEEITEELTQTFNLYSVSDCEETQINVCLQLDPDDGGYEFHSGNPQYDQSRKGFCGYGSLNLLADSYSELPELATQLVDDALEEHEKHVDCFMESQNWY